MTRPERRRRATDRRLNRDRRRGEDRRNAGLDVQGLEVRYRTGGREVPALRDVTLQVRPGETVGLVGESGSGKSTLALAALRALPPEGHVQSGRIRLGGDDVQALHGSGLRAFWRDRVRYVPQDPLPSMNPSHRVGRQLAEALDPARPRRAARDEMLGMLERVGLPDPARVARAYPFELSGGMQQRVMIAMALLGSPDLLVLDEPTTNLDVTTEAAILELVRDLVHESDAAVLYVSHSLGVVAQLCDRVSVLYAGEGIEEGPVERLYAQPLHPYTRGLLDAVPRLGARRSRQPLRPVPGRIPSTLDLPPGCVFAPRCPLAEDACRAERQPTFDAGDGRSVRCRRFEGIRDGTLDPRQPVPEETPEAQPEAGAEAPAALAARGLSKRFPVRRGVGDVLRRRPAQHVHALRSVDLEVAAERTLGLVGESGSGKSTFARAVVGLEPADGGRLHLGGEVLPPRLGQRGRPTLRRLQMVFQSSDEALAPHRTVGETLRRPLVRLAGLPRAEADAYVARLLESVRLPPAFASRRPDQLSGGEKQRVAVARAFAADPELILFDESVSGLDVSVQATVVNLLESLQRERASAYLFISHDLAVVSHLAHDIAVLYLGAVMEAGPAPTVLQPPYHPYTEALLGSVPRIGPRAAPRRAPLEGDVPSPLEAPAGCPFATRCPRVLGDVCFQTPPPIRSVAPGHRMACHIPLEELAADQEPLVGGTWS